MVEPAGTGPGKLTADGCAVDLYRQLPEMGEAVIVHASIRPGASVLDLGCGTGRIAHPLIELGHPVLGVDQSADMLAHVRGAETVCAAIAGLDLGHTFGGVLLASHLINTPSRADRRALLETARRHLPPGGRLMADITDVDQGRIDSGTKVRMSFRVKDRDEKRGFVRYFWKAVPA